MAKELELQYYAKRLPTPLRNKYALVGLVFVLWMLFFDRNNVISQIRLRQTKSGLMSKIEYHRKNLQETERRRQEIFTDNASIEQFAREEYYFKRNNEDVFIFEKENNK